MKIINLSLYYFISILLLLIPYIVADNRNKEIYKESDKIITTKNRQLSEDPHVIEIDSINYYTEITINRDDEYIISLNENIIQDFFENNILLTILGSSMTNFELSPIDSLEDIKPINKYFHNGYALIFNERLLYLRLKLQLKLINCDSELIHIRTRPLNKNSQIIRYNHHIDLFFEKNLFEEECFLFDSSNDDYYADLRGNVYDLQFLSYTKNIKCILKNENEKQEIEINKE